MVTPGTNKESILNFQTFVSAMPHYAAKTTLQLNRFVNGEFSFARPAVHANERHIVVGSDNTEGPQILLCVDANIAKGDMATSAITAQIPLPKSVQATHWIGPNRLMVCLGGKEGPSNIQFFNLDVGGDHGFELKDDSLTTKHTVREMAVNSLENNKVIYGGYDQALSLVDFNHSPQPTMVFPTEGDVSSVRWDAYHQGRLVSCTTNEGQLRIYDVHGKREPAWQYQTDVRSHMNLYSHCQISEYQIVMGYEDNYMEAVDIRKSQSSSSLSNFMAGTTDPYCYMVGDLHYREASGLLLATGMADCSVYKHFRAPGPDKNNCKLWCHSEAVANRVRNDNQRVRHGCFLSDNWVVSTQEGSMSLFKIE